MGGNETGEAMTGEEMRKSHALVRRWRKARLVVAFSVVLINGIRFYGTKVGELKLNLRGSYAGKGRGFVRVLGITILGRFQLIPIHLLKKNLL